MNDNQNREKLNMQEQETITIRNLATGYKGKHKTHIVARDINASIYAGELTCLLGANGAGKSTLLHTLSGFLPKLSGEIRIMNKEVEKYSDADMSKVISVVLTEKCDLRNMTVEEMVALGRSPYTGFWGVLKKGDKEIVSRAIAGVGIEVLTGRMMHTLSDGEKQKVMIAKALAQETPVIFLDEPTAFLDFPSKVEMMQLLHRLSRDTGKTIFMSTHDLELALETVDRIQVFYAGYTIEDARTADFEREETLRHPYTRALWRAMPKNGFHYIDGVQPYARDMKPGCPFAPRCEKCVDKCYGEVPWHLSGNGYVRCIYDS